MGALGAAISGLQSSQKWLDVISNNVSNSNTVAYKSGRLTFGDLISEGLRSASGPNTTSNLGGINPNQVGLGVTVASVQTIMKQGALQTTGNVADIAVQGSGFLTISKGTETLYTRAGNLTFDQQGNLVTTDGGQVQGWSLTNTTTYDPLTNRINTITTKLDTSSPAAIGNIKVPNNLVLAPKATSQQLNASVKTEGVVIKGNLDNNTPLNANSTGGAGTQIVTGAALAAGDLAGVLPDAVNTFTVYDSLGTAWDMTLWWFQNQVTPANQASWDWAMFYTPAGVSPSDTAALMTAGSKVADSAGYPGGIATNANTSVGPITFNADGSLLDNGTGTISNVAMGLEIPNGAVGPGGAAGVLNFSLNFGTPADLTAVPPVMGLRDGLTGDYGSGTFDPLTGVYTPVQTVYTDFVDGYAEGTLTGLSFNQTGGVDARFSNGQVLEVAKLGMSKFANQDGLERVGGNYFRATANSGLAQVGVAGSVGFGSIVGGALEGSNVDLTVELTNMILAQRMFESNARVVTAADRVLDTLVNLGR